MSNEDFDFERMCSDIEKALNGVSCALADLKAQYAVSDMLAKVPLTLDFQPGEFIHFVDADGSINGERYSQIGYGILTLNHRAFKSEYMAKLFAEKTQFIADCLFFKQMYDADYEPDFTNDKPKYGVAIDDNGKFRCYCVGRLGWRHNSEVYFSSEEIAQNCAEWLNLKNHR